MKKLLLLSIIFLLQSFPSYSDLNGKSIYCIKHKNLFFNSNNNKYENVFPYSSGNLIDDSGNESHDHWGLIFKDDLLYISQVFKKWNKDGFDIIGGLSKNEPSNDEYLTSDKYIEWKYKLGINQKKQEYIRYRLNRQTLELKEYYPISSNSINVFKCNLYSQRKIFQKLNERKNYFLKLENKIRKKNKI